MNEKPIREVFEQYKHLDILLSDEAWMIEHVHHIDANKLNNHPDNLLVLSPSEHRHLHRQLEVLALELVASGKIIFNDGEYKWNPSI